MGDGDLDFTRRYIRNKTNASGRASKRDRMLAPVRKIRLRMRAEPTTSMYKNPFRTKQYDVCSPEELLPEIYEAPGFPRADRRRIDR